MDKEENYIEKLVKNISADKNRMMCMIFSALSVICSLMYVTTVGTSGVHLVFVLAMVGAAATNILYGINTELKIKCADDCIVFGVAAMVIGSVLKVIRVGVVFSVEYFIGYFIYALTFLLLGLHFTKNQAKPKLIKVFLLICMVWSIFEFFRLSSSFITGIVWKIFRMSEAFLAISYFFLLSKITQNEISFSENLGKYKKQIPSLKICIAIVLVISLVSGVIGFVMNIGKSNKNNVVNKTVTEEKIATEKPRKSTVTSVVVPAEQKPAEIEEIKIGDSIETDSFTLKLNKVEISRRVEPDNPPSYYTYYQAQENHAYIYVNTSVTNKEKHSLECDEIYSVTADFDGGYEYKGFNIADDDDGDFTYSNITSIEPLETLGVHCLVDCPQTIEEEGKPLFITLNLKNGSKYKYIIK